MTATGNRADSGGAFDVLIVEIGGRHYGLPAAAVRELLRAAAIVPVHEAPGVEGVLNLHGTVVSVLDLRSRLHLPAKKIEPSDHFIVIAVASRVAVLRVDETIELVRLGGADLASASRELADVDCVSQFAKRPGELVPILDLEAIMSHPDAALLPGASRASGPTADRETQA
ncbi:MAG TPA: chemotaxis protein CheW [Pirellulales bacterium]|nr:chemotaxis protein CheW [Pirellulales bacterium]